MNTLAIASILFLNAAAIYVFVVSVRDLIKSLQRAEPPRANDFILLFVGLFILLGTARGLAIQRRRNEQRHRLQDQWNAALKDGWTLYQEAAAARDADASTFETRFARFQNSLDHLYHLEDAANIDVYPLHFDASKLGDCRANLVLYHWAPNRTPANLMNWSKAIDRCVADARAGSF